MTPFENPVADSPEARYNFAHAVTRSSVERCIGTLKNRFRCLMGERKLRYSPDKVGTIINACTILHNMCIRAEIAINQEFVPQRAVVPPQDEFVQNDVLPEGRRIRQQIVNLYFQNE